MRALTVQPGVEGSARLDDVDDTGARDQDLVVEPLLVGVCGTDREIVDGAYGTPPAGHERMVLGHEAIGRVVHSSTDGWSEGDLVVPIVRRPDPVPCSSCAAGEWDMCLNGRYTEHGIKGADGFARERFALDPEFAVAVPPELGDLAVLVEPASIVAKAWEQISRIGGRSHWEPRVVLVTGAGPVGLLAALMACQQGFDTFVLDRVTSGPKPDLVEQMGATYRTGPIRESCSSPDIVVECTGAGALVFDAVEHSSRSGVVCLAGLSSGARAVEMDAVALNRRLVLENDVVFGTVNANRRHYEAAVRALCTAERSWLEAVVTRRVPLHHWADALERRPDDVKVAWDIAG